MYAVLPARGAIIGLLSVEHEAIDHFDERNLELLAGFAEPAALAVDNARWFGRLRTVGAEEERNRIARDLHDRIGQSLAYLAFELDRIVKAGARDDDVRPALGELREDVRTVIREVRDTLYDLRTDVSDEQGFLDTLELFLGRVRERSALEVTVRTEETSRLPLPQERELFRIAQEAIVNVERHAAASHVTVTWRCDGQEALLEVADDGQGFPIGRSGRLDSYGLLGMRERAASIGAALDVDSVPDRGTRVRLTLGQRHRAART
jgi:signal transduction histidine kinase